MDDGDADLGGGVLPAWAFRVIWIVGAVVLVGIGLVALTDSVNGPPARVVATMKARAIAELRRELQAVPLPAGFVFASEKESGWQSGAWGAGASDEWVQLSREYTTGLPRAEASALLQKQLRDHDLKITVTTNWNRDGDDRIRVGSDHGLHIRVGEGSITLSAYMQA